MYMYMYLLIYHKTYNALQLTYKYTYIVGVVNIGSHRVTIRSPLTQLPSYAEVTSNTCFEQGRVAILWGREGQP